MSLFEYLAIAFSLVISFSAMRLVSGLPYALGSSRRYWVHASLVFVQLFVTAGTFWVFWSYRDVEWTFQRFLLVLAIPVLVAYNACALIPDAPASIESWRAHYFFVRRRYFVAICLWASVVTVATTVVLEMPLFHPARALHAGAFAVGVVGATSANPRLHAAIATFLLCFAVLSAFAVVSRPGALAQ